MQRALRPAENARFIMTRYAIKRVLYRFSLWPFCEVSVLKGAKLFSLWVPTPYRAPGDFGLLGSCDSAPARVAEIFRRVLDIDYLSLLGMPTPRLKAHPPDTPFLMRRGCGLQRG